MPYQPLHQKYRPQTFAELVGQNAIATTLTNAIAKLKIAPAYLFTGSRGTGKTSTARILAKSLNCQGSNLPTANPCGKCNSCLAIAKGVSLDVTEIDAASNSGVENIREIIERCQFAPVESRYKIYTVDEVHSLSSQAFQALLKTLEEPPANVVFILCTTEAQKVPATIASRCQRFDFKRIGLQTTIQHLSFIAREELIDITPVAIRLVAQLCNGGMRDAETLLDQLSLFSDPITPEMVGELVGSIKEQDLLLILNAIASNDSKQLLAVIRKVLESGKDALNILQSIAGIFRDLLIAKTTPTKQEMVALTQESWEQLCQDAQTWDVPNILVSQQHLRQCEVQVKLSTQPQLWLEIAILGLLPDAKANVENRPTVVTEPEPVTPPWVNWAAPADAIAWAHRELPHLSVETLQQHMNSLNPVNGKKAPAWVEFIKKQKAR